MELVGRQDQDRCPFGLEQRVELQKFNSNIIIGRDRESRRASCCSKQVSATVRDGRVVRFEKL